MGNRENIEICGNSLWHDKCLKNTNNYNNIIDGKYKITSELSINKSNEEKFVISFLKIFFEKLENEKDNKFALSKLIQVLGYNTSNLSGSIIKQNNIYRSNDIMIQNNGNKILISGNYNLTNDKIEIDLNLKQQNEIYITAKIIGTLYSPEILIDKNSKYLKNFNKNNNVIEEVIIQFLDKFLKNND